MCHRIEYFLEGERVLVYFDAAHAELPVRKRSGAIEFVTWGARGERYLSDDNTPGYLLKFPVGGWAAGVHTCRRVGKVQPRPVRIVASRFVFNHAQLGPLFFALGRGEYIQGLLAQAALQRRVYVVTVPAPPEHADRLDEWPRESRHRVRP